MNLLERVGFGKTGRESRERSLIQVQQQITLLQEELRNSDIEENSLINQLNSIGTKQDIEQWKEEIQQQEEIKQKYDNDVKDIKEVAEILNYYKHLESLTSINEIQESLQNLIPNETTLYKEMKTMEQQLNTSINITDTSITFFKFQGDINFHKQVWKTIIDSDFSMNKEMIVIYEEDFIKICFGAEVDDFDDFVVYLKEVLNFIDKIVVFYSMSEDAVFDVTGDIAMIFSTIRENCGESEFDKEWNDEVITDVFKDAPGEYSWKKLIYMLFMDKGLD
ncbi:Uncharacterized protein QTN25_001818 [Entamoeba marina]